MENKYQTITENFFYSPTSLIYMPNGQIVFPNATIPEEMLIQPKVDYETAFFHLQRKYEQLRVQNQDLKKQLHDNIVTALNTQRPQSPSRILKRKLTRRKEDQLDKKYGCCYENCRKYYASELALNLHIKTKHKGGTKKQREDLAKQIILAQAEGKPAPKQLFRLPEGFIEQYRTEHRFEAVKDIKAGQ